MYLFSNNLNDFFLIIFKKLLQVHLLNLLKLTNYHQAHIVRKEEDMLVEQSRDHSIIKKQYQNL